MARAAGARTSPSASIGKGSGGGSSRISGRGGSGFISSPPSTSSRTRAAPETSGGVMLTSSISATALYQHVRHVGVGLGRHHDAHAPTFREPPLRGIGRSTLADPVRVVVRTDEHHACLRGQHERTNAAGREPGPRRYSACGRNRQRRLNALSDAQPCVQTHLAEPYCPAADRPKRSPVASMVVRRQVGSMDSYDAALNMLNERDHGWQVSSDISVPASGCPAQGGGWRDADASAREIAHHRAPQRVVRAVPDAACARDPTTVFVVTLWYHDRMPAFA